VARPAELVDPTEAALGPLQERLGHRFAKPELLALALTHRSWCAENEGYESNERLEFLGDAVLGLVVTDHLFNRHGELAEGEMAKARSAVVSTEALADLAGELDLGAGLRLGRGEHSSGGRAKARMLADALEAVIGAVHLDAGWLVARGVVLDLVEGRVAEAVTDPGTGDHKTRLQELVARRTGSAPSYRVVETGPDHAKSFQATVSVSGEVRGAGGGRSKKQAQQAAAREAYETMAAEATDEIGGGEQHVADGDTAVDGDVVGPIPGLDRPATSPIAVRS
jgi:ribonuclease III